MKIPDWIDPLEQMCTLGKNHWSVPRLFALTRDFDVIEIPLAHLNVNYTYDCLNLRQMVMHIRAVEAADLSIPIILDENGDVMDGRHRIMKALLTGAETIKAVKFNENPSPCRQD